jgi:hypothetical protein
MGVDADRAGERVDDDCNGDVVVGELEERALEAGDSAGVPHGRTPQLVLQEQAEPLRGEGVVCEPWVGGHRRVRGSSTTPPVARRCDQRTRSDAVEQSAPAANGTDMWTAGIRVQVPWGTP